MSISYTATYSPDDNKLRIYASQRLDPETYAKVRSAGFIWAPKQDLFVAPTWTPDRADLCVELAGGIDDEDQSLTERAEDRAERFEEYQEKRTADSERAHAAVSAITNGIPLGQPILVGHHSERRARRDAQKIEHGMRRAVKLWETAEYWQRRAAGAIAHAKYKELPAVRARRIKGLEADLRKQIRARDQAETWIRSWAKLDDPYLGEEIRPGVRSEHDRRPCDEALRLKRALFLANHDHVSVRLDLSSDQYTSLWSALDRGKLTPHEAKTHADRAHAATIARAKRWIDHLTFRLSYEKAMLNEQGRSDLIAPQPKRKSAKAALPLVNYRAPEGLQVQNIYHRNELIHYPQVEMTQAEYTRINQDYKGTRVVDNSHRVRTTMQRSQLVCVFLTDSKVHERPAAKAAPEAPDRGPSTIPRVRDVPPPAPKPAIAAAVAEMKQSLRAGVQVVSAPQLFPTPPEVAARMVSLAEIQPGECVLEPSAGTGAIVQAVVDSGVDTEILAYDINPACIRALFARGWERFRVHIAQADFLQVTDHRGCYPKILMNPPFENGIDVKHVEHALTFLAPGGRLVGICADGPRQREKLQPRASSWEELPSGTFAGTGVRAALFVIEGE